MFDKNKALKLKEERRYDELMDHLKEYEKDPVSLNLQGICYMDGIGVKQDIPMGLMKMRMSAKLGYASAQYNYGYYIYTQYNDEDGYEYIERAAKQYHEDALRFLMNDALLKNEHTRAFLFSKKLSKRKDPEANYRLGEYYRTGIYVYNYDGNLMLVNKNRESAIRYLKIASEQGHLKAKLSLAKLYLEDSNHEAYVLVKDVLDHNIIFDHNMKCELYLLLGKCYYYGVGVEKDDMQALFYFDKASQLNTNNVELKGEVYYFIGFIEEVKSEENALEYYLKSAEKNYKNAEEKVSKLAYQMGMNTSRMFEKERYMLIASKYGHLEACKWLVHYYFYSVPDYCNALIQLQRYIQLDQSNADMYFKAGCIVREDDIDKAIEYFKKAYTLGKAIASLYVADCYYVKGGHEKDVYEYVNIALKHSYSYAYLVMAGLYYRGYGVQSDINVSLSYLKEAVSYERLNIVYAYNTVCELDGFKEMLIHMCLDYGLKFSHVYAQKLLGDYFALVEEYADYKSAITYYTMLQNNEHADGSLKKYAKIKIDTLETVVKQKYEHLKKEVIDDYLKQAYNLLKKAADMGDLTALGMINIYDKKDSL